MPGKGGTGVGVTGAIGGSGGVGVETISPSSVSYGVGDGTKLLSSVSYGVGVALPAGSSVIGAVSLGSGNGVGEPPRVTGTGPPKDGSTSAGTQATTNQRANIIKRGKERATGILFFVDIGLV
jgi:hypothetical protein